MSSPKFCGEGDAAIDALVDACRPQNRPSLEAPSLPHLIGRELTPYFGFSEPAEAGKKTPVNNNNKRKGASPKQVRPKPGTSAPTSPSSPTSRTVEVPAEGEKAATIISSSPSELQNKQKNKGIKATRNLKSTQQAPMMAYACPAMFMSPKPETLPLPSTGLLRNAIRPMIMTPALVAA